MNALNVVKAIRRQYPDPCAAGSFPPDSFMDGRYCVLGAACMVADPEHAYKYRFPSTEGAAQVLRIKEGYAHDITKANDCLDFEKAWNLLTEALKVRR